MTSTWKRTMRPNSDVWYNADLDASIIKPAYQFFAIAMGCKVGEFFLVVGKKRVAAFKSLTAAKKAAVAAVALLDKSGDASVELIVHKLTKFER